MDASIRGRETEAQALGKTWRFSRYDLNVWDEFLSWARTQLPDPLVVAEKAVLRLMRESRRIRDRMRLETSDKDFYDEEEGKFLLESNAELQERTQRIAMEHALSYLAVDSPEFQSMAKSHRGTARLMWLLLRKNHEGIDEDMALEIVQNLSEAEQQRIISVTQGKLPAGNVPAPPKA